MGAIVIFGDSITHGAFDLEQGGWASRLNTHQYKKSFDKTDEGWHESDVYYFGVDGDMTSDVLLRFDDQMQSLKWGHDQVVFALGTNDCALSDGRERMSIDDYAINLKKLRELALNYVSAEYITFIGIAHVDMSVSFIAKEFDYSRVQLFNQYLKEFCVKYDTKYISLDDTLTNEDLADGLHPNAEGHEKIFEEVKNSLKL